MRDVRLRKTQQDQHTRDDWLSLQFSLTGRWCHRRTDSLHGNGSVMVTDRESRGSGTLLMQQGFRSLQQKPMLKDRKRNFSSCVDVFVWDGLTVQHTVNGQYMHAITLCFSLYYFSYYSIYDFLISFYFYIWALYNSM